jgi:hypothetical protein
MDANINADINADTNANINADISADINADADITVLSEQKCCGETVTDVKCPDCDCWICEDCWIHKIDYAAQIDEYYCDDCFKNRDPTIRGTCISCEYIDNLEEGTECNNCGYWVCVSCIKYKDDGNYYCVECFNR